LRHLMLITAYGDYYQVNPKGEIIRMDIKGFEPSGGWIFLGLEHVKRNQFIPLADITPETVASFTTYKNGNPQWTVRDRDHGTMRTWGNTKYHGIKRVYFLEVKN